MTLGTRFFLLVWALVVSAMVILAVVLGRWSMNALEQVYVQQTVTRTNETTQERSVTTLVGVGGSPQELLSRRILLAVVVGSVLAAVAAAALSRPLVGRVHEMSIGVSALRAGNLEARVPERGNDELTDLASAFNAMAADLDVSEQRRRQLLSDVSHELRTPLTNLVGGLEAMQDGLRRGDGNELAALHDEAMLLVRLVNDLRDVTLADAGELAMQPVALHAHAEAQHAADSFPPGTDRAPIEVVCADDARDLLVRADRSRLAQILRNLLGNARMHAPADTTIRFTVSRDESFAVFSVHNYGQSIPPDALPRVWDRFYRVDGSRSRATGGMGLGLAIVKRLVEAQGGRVSAESVAGTGTTFRVALPVVEATASEA